MKRKSQGKGKSLMSVTPANKTFGYKTLLHTRIRYHALMVAVRAVSAKKRRVPSTSMSVTGHAQVQDSSLLTNFHIYPHKNTRSLGAIKWGPNDHLFLVDWCAVRGGWNLTKNTGRDVQVQRRYHARKKNSLRPLQLATTGRPNWPLPFLKRQSSVN